MPGKEEILTKGIDKDHRGAHHSKIWLTFIIPYGKNDWTFLATLKSFQEKEITDTEYETLQ
jgi:hypothetical protein